MNPVGSSTVHSTSGSTAFVNPETPVNTRSKLEPFPNLNSDDVKPQENNAVTKAKPSRPPLKLVIARPPVDSAALPPSPTVVDSDTDRSVSSGNSPNPNSRTLSQPRSPSSPHSSQSHSAPQSPSSKPAPAEEEPFYKEFHSYFFKKNRSFLGKVVSCFFGAIFGLLISPYLYYSAVKDIFFSKPSTKSLQSVVNPEVNPREEHQNKFKKVMAEIQTNADDMLKKRMLHKARFATTLLAIKKESDQLAFLESPVDLKEPTLSLSEQSKKQTQPAKDDKPAERTSETHLNASSNNPPPDDFLEQFTTLMFIPDKTISPELNEYLKEQYRNDLNLFERFYDANRQLRSIYQNELSKTSETERIAELWLDKRLSQLKDRRELFEEALSLNEKEVILEEEL